MRRWVVWLSLLAASGCESTSTAPTPVADAPYSTDARQALAQAESRWLARGPRNYDFTVRVSCIFCSLFGPNQVRFEVRDGVSTALDATPATAERFRYLSRMELVFADIHRVLDYSPFFFNAEYDPSTGHPVVYSVDYRLETADDEGGTGIRDFVAR